MSEPAGRLSIRQDPTELRLFGLVYQHEYDPGEFSSVWFAREMIKEHAEWVMKAWNAEIEAKKVKVPRE